MPEDLYEDPFLAPLYDPIYEGLEKAGAGVPRGDVAFYVERARAAGGTVLELGCGTGRVYLPMLEAGVVAAGLDTSRPMLDVLRAKARERGLAPDVHEADMREFHLGRRFTLITCPFRTFQHLIGPEDQLRCLGRVREHLEPGGRLVLNVFHPHHGILSSDRSEPRLDVSLEREDGSRLRRYSQVVPHLEEQVMEVTFLYEERDPGGEVRRRRGSTRLWLYYRYEMVHLFARAGFEVESLNGGFDGGPLRHGGEMIWTLRTGDGASP